MESPDFVINNLPDLMKSKSVNELISDLQLFQLTKQDWQILLGVASYHGMLELVNLLLEKGLDIDFRFISLQSLSDTVFSFSGLESYQLGSTPLGNTILGQAWEGSRMLVRLENEAQGYSYINTMKCLIEAGANVNEVTYSGYTPLQLAIVMECKELVSFLYESGADPYLSSEDLDKPDSFFFAKKAGSWAIEILNANK